MNIQEFWDAVLKQDAEKMRTYFREDAYVNWHCTNENFTVEEFIRVNCEYPGVWEGEVVRVEEAGDLLTTVAHVHSIDQSLSFHVTSFIRTMNDKIISIDEYWADDGIAPAWRLDKKIGRPIKSEKVSNQVS